MTSFKATIKVRIGEFVNRILRVYGRQKLLLKLSRLPMLEQTTGTEDANTVCLVMGTARTSAQFLLTAYLWKLYLPPNIPLRLMHDGPLPKKVYDLAHQLFGKKVKLVDARSLAGTENTTVQDEKWHHFIEAHRFARKLLALQILSERHNVIYSDDDILLFQSPSHMLAAVEHQVDFLYSPDTSGVPCPVHNEMMEYGRSIGVTPLPDFQAGLLYVRKGLLKRTFLDKYLSCWTPENDMNFSEQTLLSLVLAENPQGILLPSDRYINDGATGRFLWQEDMNYFDGKIILRHFMGTVRHRYFRVADEILNNILLRPQNSCK